jgi:hypothetical protein
MGKEKNSGDTKPQTTGSPATPTKRCRVCAEPIHPSALKCKECNAFQDWRSHLFEWSGLGTAVLALIPLWGLAVAGVKVLSGNAPDVQMAAASCGKARVELLVANASDKSVALFSARTAVLIDGKPQELGRFVLSPVDPKETLLKANEQQHIILEPKAAGGALVPFPAAPTGAQCRIEVSATFRGFGDRTADAKAECACPSE